ncbi:MAG: hypothetical protein WDZ61_00445 [Parcubacteria group bacterium]
MNKPTQTQLIFQYLQDHHGWIPAYAFVKVELYGCWIGTSGDRAARSLALNEIPEYRGLVERKDGKDIQASFDALGKPIERRYTYYRYKPQEQPQSPVEGQQEAHRPLNTRALDPASVSQEENQERLL